MDIRYMDEEIIVCIKPPRVLSTDEVGGLPELLRAQLGISDVRTVHRLDRVVSGLMVLARNETSASMLSQQIRSGSFEKEYLALAHGNCPDRGEMRDLLLRNKAERKTYVTDAPGKGVQEAILEYETLHRDEGRSLVRIRLVTGRTHQIRCQFAHRGFPLLGDRKYSTREDPCEIALWSHKLSFIHPATGKKFEIEAEPPEDWPCELKRI